MALFNHLLRKKNPLTENPLATSANSLDTMRTLATSQRPRNVLTSARSLMADGTGVPLLYVGGGLDKWR